MAVRVQGGGQESLPGGSVIRQRREGYDPTDALNVTHLAQSGVLTAAGVYLVNATSGAVTLTLSLPAGAKRQVSVKKVDASANAVTLRAVSGGTIDGAATAVLTAQQETLVLLRDGLNWVAVPQGGPAGPAGATGLPGHMSFGLDGADGEDGWSIPGPPGQQGVPGLPGFSMDGQDGEDGMPGPPGIPGGAGATGATGATGTPGFGMDGADGEDGWPIPGPMGPAGAGRFYGAHVVATSPQSCANGAGTYLNFDTVIEDSNSFYNAGNPSRLTVPAGAGGRYLVIATVALAAGVNLAWYLQPQVNRGGTLISRAAFTSGGTTSIGGPVVSAGIINLVPGDYVEAQVFLATGATRNTLISSGGSYDPSLTLIRIEQNGATGATGAQGVMGFGMDGADGEDAWPMPGPAGAPGGAGAAGSQGSVGFGMDGLDGEDAWPMPGPAGPLGPAGVAVFHGCRVYMNAADQAIANNTVVALTMDGSRYDTDGFHSNVTNNTRITIPAGQDGYYHIHGVSKWAALGGAQTGLLNMFVQINGTGNQIAATAYLSPAGGSNVNELNVACDYYLNAGDYIELAVYQFTGVGCTVSKSSVSGQITEFMVHRIAGPSGAAVGIYTPLLSDWPGDGVTKSDGIMLTDWAGGAGYKVAKRTAPAAPYHQIIGLRANALTQNNVSWGIGWQDAVTGKSLVVGFFNASIWAAKLNAGYAWTANDTATVPDMSRFLLRGHNYFLVEDDSTNIKCSFSPDGVNWVLIYSQPRAAWCNPDQIFVYCVAPSPISMLFDWYSASTVYPTIHA